MEAIRVTDKEWEIAGVHYVRTEAMCNGFGVSLEMEFGEDKAGDEYILVLDGIHPVSTCRLHQLDENTGKIERVATLKEYRGQHYGAAAITAAEEWFAERGVKKIFINSRTEAVGFYEKLGYVADPKQITGTGANVKPYTYVGDDNETTGYDVEVLKEVFDRLDGYDLQIEVTDIPSVFSGVTSGTYQIGVNNFSYNEERAKSYLYSYPYDKIGYVFITKKGAPEVKTFADAAGKSFEGQSGVSVTTAIENWNEKNPDKKIDITYTDADTAITLQHIEDGTTDLAIIDVAMYNAYQKEYNYDVVANQISDEDAKAIADNSYAYYIFPKDQEELRDKVDEQLKELKKDGTLSKLSQKYFGQDTAPEDDQFEKTPN